MKKFFTLCAVLPFLISAAPADAASGRVMLANDYYVVVQTDPSYLDRYTAGRLISFPSSDLYAGDPVSGVDVDKWDVPAEEAMEYFSKNSR